MASTLPAWTSSRSRCRAGRSVLPPEKPPSSYLALRRVQPAWAWLRIYVVDPPRAELQLETLAYHTSQEAAHRVLLPAGCLHHRGNRCACGRLQHSDDTGLFVA